MPVGRAVRFVQPVGVDDRDGGRKRGGTLMMVDDDHLHAAVPCGRERPERLRAAIDGDDKPRAFPPQSHQRLGRWAIDLPPTAGKRSDQRRVGKRGGSTSESRVGPYYEK